MIADLFITFIKLFALLTSQALFPFSKIEVGQGSHEILLKKYTNIKELISVYTFYKIFHVQISTSFENGTKDILIKNYEQIKLIYFGYILKI